MKKEIKGFNGRYIVEDNGNIYSNGRLMKPYVINSGYLAIKLQYKGVRYHYLVHRLVAEYFLSGDGDIVDHIDGDRLNNNFSNLRYCTQKENLHFHGYDYNSGCNHYKSYLSEEEISYMRHLYEDKKLEQHEIKKLYPNIPQQTINQILNYKTHKKIPC